MSDTPLTTVELNHALALGSPGLLVSRVLVGVDGSESSFDACRQAARVASPEAFVEAVTVVHLSDAAQAGFSALFLADQLAREAEEALAKAVAILGPETRTRSVNGYVTPALLAEVERVDATLLAIGSHGHRRMTEILIGGPVGELLHRAPCSVLIARAPSDPAAFPGSIVVGIDGSPEADLALAAAQELQQRVGGRERVITALGGKDVDLAHAHLRCPFTEEIDGHPVEALVEASAEADLVVVGSRGLHGFHALGSVSERVAHQARCSVLVVRS
jgi:nucleotide-binding universal stress UspA family protein